MGYSLDVYVQNGNGNPVADMGVEIAIDGIVCGGSLRGLTDGEGRAHFETGTGFEDRRRLAYAGDRRFGPFRLAGGLYTVELG